MPAKDAVSWTAMISGYASLGDHCHAWRTFINMFHVGRPPNEYTLSSVLKACKRMGNVNCGGLVHGFAVKLGLQGLIYVDNRLIDMYASCCLSMKDAWAVFREIQKKNEVSWTTLISGYTHKGRAERVLQYYREMMLDREVDGANPFTFSIVIRACASTGSRYYVEQMHAAVVKNGFRSSLPVMNSVLDMYCWCGCLTEANQCFYEMTEKDLISRNTLIAGCDKLDPNEAFVIFSEMERENFSPNCFTLTSVVAACADLAALNCGQQVHGVIIYRGLDSNLALANALIDMYAKCGNIADSCKLFSKMPVRDLLSWTSVMIGNGAHGYGREAVGLFDEMVRSGIKPDQVVFMGVLSACSHAGLVDQGLTYFNSMMDRHKVEPNQEIYGCAVDLLGRAGRVEDGMRVNYCEVCPSSPLNLSGVLSLGHGKRTAAPNMDSKLTSCDLSDLRPDLAGTCVMLSQIYAAEGKWE